MKTIAKKKVIGKRGTVVLTKDGTAKSTPVGPVVKSSDKMAEVRVGIGSTLNMGNYESLRLGVDISLPCTEKDLEKKFSEALSLAEKNLEKMIKKFKGPQEQVLPPGKSNKRSAQDVLDDEDEIDPDDLESDNPDDEVDL
jgi:hypothetical protein